MRGNDSRHYGLAAAGIALLLLVVHLPLLFGHVAPIWDAREAFGPYQMLLGDYARSGRLLLWNPFTLAGEPAAIDPQLGAFSPVMVLLGLLFGGSRVGFELYWYCAWLLGPLGIIVLGRHLHAPAWGSYVVAAGFALSGFYTGHAEHTIWLSTLSFLPLVIWRLDVALERRLLRPAVEAGALWGLSGLAGYPALVFLNACFAAAWCKGRVLQRDRSWTGAGRASLALLTMGAVGLMVLAPAYVAFFVEGRGYSHRTGALSYEVAVTNNALNPLGLLTLLNPRLAFSEAMSYTDISSRSLYLGVLIPALAVLALIRRADWLRWALAATGLVFAAAALGRTLPVRGWLYDWIAITRYFRHPAMFGAYLMMSLTLLALLGATELSRIVGPAIRRVFVPVLVVIATADALMTARLLQPLMYDPSAVTWTGLDARHVSSVDLTSHGLERVADNGSNDTLVAKTPALSGYAAITGPLVREYMSDSVLKDAATGPSRLWFASTVGESLRSSGCLERLRDAARRLGAPPLVIHQPLVMDASAGAAGQGCDTDISALPAARRVPASAVQVLEYTPQRLAFRVHVDDSGWLLVTDSWSRGWSAVVNGKPAAVFGGNFLFRAVRVGPGTNSVEFRYRPFGYPWLLLLSWATLATVAVSAWKKAR